MFKTGNILNCGDHIPWHNSLDGKSHSQIQQMLIVEDPQLGSVSTPHGHFQFRQIVGVTESELKAAQRWKGDGVLDMLARVPETAGVYYVTDMARQQSLFDMCPDLIDELIDHIQREGSKLGHVNSVCSWSDGFDSDTISMESDMSDLERSLSSVQIQFDLEAAELLPLIAKGRLMKGRYFVFQNVSGQVIVFIPPEFTADMVTVTGKLPLKAQGQALQIFCSLDFTIQMVRELEILEHADQLHGRLPLVFHLKNPNITITVMDRRDQVSHTTI